LQDKGVATELFEILNGDLNIISDSAAQTIASWWHSPRREWTAALSTAGIVSFETDIDDFCDPEEYDNCEAFDRACIDALREYILTKQRESHVEYPHEFGYFNECEACTSMLCPCVDPGTLCVTADCDYRE
jgi:hypothetical protein